jgi:hypothetical protein
VAGGPDATVGVLVLIDDQNAVIGEKISESASFPADDQAALEPWRARRSSARPSAAVRSSRTICFASASIISESRRGG